MTFLSTLTMPHTRRRKLAMERARDLTEPLPQVTQWNVRALHIVVTRGVVARTLNPQGRNMRLEIWLAGWHIGVYDEFGEKPRRLGAR